MTDKGNQRSNRDKPNRGQDENLHTFVHPDGRTQEATMREFRSSLRDQGFRKPEDAEDTEAPTPAVTEPETPA